MKLNVILLMSSLICVSGVFAGQQDESLYFCTRDLDNFNSSVGSSIASSADSVQYYYFGDQPKGYYSTAKIAGGIVSYQAGSASNILPSSGLRKDAGGDLENLSVVDRLNNWHNITFRHCFLMRAVPKDKIELIRQGMTEKYDLLSVKSTIGFYGTGRGNEADYSQEKFKKSVYSCQKIKPFSQKADILDAWRNIEAFFDNEKREKGYYPINHNCCSVAYDALMDLVSKNVINRDDLEKINTVSFNLGLGIRYRFEPDDSFLKTVLNLSSDNLLYAFSSPTEESSNKKDDL